MVKSLVICLLIVLTECTKVTDRRTDEVGTALQCTVYHALCNSSVRHVRHCAVCDGNNTIRRQTDDFVMFQLLECMYVRQALDLLEGLIPVSEDNKDISSNHLKLLIVFSVMWSLGALLELSDRQKVGHSVRAR